ncbi:hypothetical protein CTAYLR_008679 [Chrysophaeum taylorii]|uniref:Protein LOW PSII ACCUMULATION 1, chloroplastic n=1 Tax=Chrysophaeum taylorii TaxID=2483200 RepID=A0AAD7XQH4_9STRA|nr:hypothetical protein CTAYLR_008679 [Chrysophaeum taylorii]
MFRRHHLLLFVVVVVVVEAFVVPPPSSPLLVRKSLNEDDGTGYTPKQRLREEIDSPFRKIRVTFFGFSTASALVALYFSLLTLGKAAAGWEGPSIDVAASDVAINVAAVSACGFLTYRDVKAGEANLERIAKGGQLASLRVAPADGTPTRALARYRQLKRVVVAAGGVDYVSELARDVLAVASDLRRLNVVLVPVFLDSRNIVDADKTRTIWRDAQGTTSSSSSISDAVVSFPALSAPWAAYLDKEIETAKSQNIDPNAKGLGIYIKKNGRILRRATGQPDWPSFLGTMEVMDGSQFGKPRL